MDNTMNSNATWLNIWGTRKEKPIDADTTILTLQLFPRRRLRLTLLLTALDCLFLE